MDDNNRLFAGGSLWIWILLAFLLFSGFGRGGVGGGGGLGGLGSGLDCAFPNLFGCGDRSNTFMWIIIAVLAYMLLAGDGGMSIFRNEIQ